MVRKFLALTLVAGMAAFMGACTQPGGETPADGTAPTGTETAPDSTAPAAPDSTAPAAPEESPAAPEGGQ
jgi:hypothetical protein